MELTPDKLKELQKERRSELEKAWLRFMGLPEDCLDKFSDFVAAYSYEELAKPFIARDLVYKREGIRHYTIHKLQKKYVVGERCIRRIGVEVGVYRN
jgi:hypothetical protein